MSSSLREEVKEAFNGKGASPPLPKPTLTVAETIEPALLNIHAAANYLSISTTSVRAEMHAGRLTAKAFGTKPLFALTELNRYVDAMPSWEPK